MRIPVWQQQEDVVRQIVAADQLLLDGLILRHQGTGQTLLRPRRILVEKRGDLFAEDYWDQLQRRILAGKLHFVTPYPPERHLAKDDV